uniref:Uncharacterized protein n=1 Tax=Rhizophora mucronata TaxID=61149 RepID=A0A2P2IK48_RHIMU
MFLLFVFF